MTKDPQPVKRLPSDPGPAAWNELLPARTPYPSLQENSTVDCVVIGAGFTGLSAARRFIELNPTGTVAVLDATGIAEGPAGRNSGFMIDLPHVLTSNGYSGNGAKDVIDSVLNRAGIEYAMQAKERFGLSDEAITLSGKINGAVTDKGQQHNNNYASHLANMGEPFERLDHNVMQEVTGSHAYLDGIFTPGTAMIQPAMFIRSLAEGITSLNVRIHEQTPVMAMGKSGNDWVVKTPQGQLTCATVILAVNGHLESFGFYKRRLMHVHTFASMSEKLSPDQIKRLGGKSQWAITPADPLGTTVRRISGTGGDRLIIRNRSTYNASLRVNESCLASISKTHDQSFHDRFPMLGDVRMAYRWGGRLCLSRNDVPVFGEIEPGLIAACCQNGLGTAKGTIAGKLAAELACGHGSDLLDDIGANPLPTRLPIEPFASLGATAYIRFGEWRAGKEL